MKRLVYAALASAFFALSAPADSSRRCRYSSGGGATIPVSDFSDFPGVGTDGANTGWQGTLVAQFAVGEAGLFCRPRVYYGSNNHDTTGDKTNLYGGTALVNYAFGDPEVVNPFLWDEFGFMAHSFKSDLLPLTEGRDTAAWWLAGPGRLPARGSQRLVSCWIHQGPGRQQRDDLHRHICRLELSPRWRYVIRAGRPLEDLAATEGRSYAGLPSSFLALSETGSPSGCVVDREADPDSRVC